MVIVANFPNAYKEVYEILKYVEPEDVKLIPQDFMDMIERNMNNNHEFKYNPNLSFDKQGVLRETKSVFSYIFLNYWANEEQKKRINATFRQDVFEDEERKKAQYATNSLFEKEEKRTIKQENKQLIEYKNESFVVKIINKIKKWFKA